MVLLHLALASAITGPTLLLLHDNFVQNKILTIIDSLIFNCCRKFFCLFFYLYSLVTKKTILPLFLNQIFFPIVTTLSSPLLDHFLLLFLDQFMINCSKNENLNNILKLIIQIYLILSSKHHDPK